MTLYIAHSISHEMLNKQDFDLAIVYKHAKLYDKIQTNKILLNQNGKIIKENFFANKDIKNIEQLKQLTFRTALIYFSCNKALMTIDMYGKQKQSMLYSLSEQSNTVKNTIKDIETKEELEKIINVSQTAIYQILIQAITVYKGKKFVKMYQESIEFLWNISQSLFYSYLYHNFAPIKNYEYLLNSYVYFFCIDFIKKIGFDINDVDSNYMLNQNAIELIYKKFNENLHKLHKQKRGDIDTLIADELKKLSEFDRFEV
jgi:hypothetical protein